MRTKTHADGSQTRLYEIGDEVIIRDTVHSWFRDIQIGKTGKVQELDRKDRPNCTINAFYILGEDLPGNPMVFPWMVEPTDATLAAATEDPTL